MGLFSKIFGGGEPKPGEPFAVTEETFADEVLKSDVPVIVDFWAVWCSPCKVMSGLLREIGPDYIGKLKIVKLNTEENPNIAVKYQIRSIPTLIFFRKGKPVDKVIGLLPMHPLRKRIDFLVK